MLVKIQFVAENLICPVIYSLAVSVEINNWYLRIIRVYNTLSRCTGPPMLILNWTSSNTVLWQNCDTVVKKFRLYFIYLIFFLRIVYYMTNNQSAAIFYYIIIFCLNFWDGGLLYTLTLLLPVSVDQSPSGFWTEIFELRGYIVLILLSTSNQDKLSRDVWYSNGVQYLGRVVQTVSVEK